MKYPSNRPRTGAAAGKMQLTGQELDVWTAPFTVTCFVHELQQDLILQLPHAAPHIPFYNLTPCSFTPAPSPGVSNMANR